MYVYIYIYIYINIYIYIYIYILLHPIPIPKSNPQPTIASVAAPRLLLVTRLAKFVRQGLTHLHEDGAQALQAALEVLPTWEKAMGK